MNQKIKISQLPAKGSNLAAADLLEIAEFTGTGYISKSITGQEIIDAIPLPPSGITIGTTAITSGTVGRVLFEGTGNVVQESANLFWDETNGRLGINTSSPVNTLDIIGSRFRHNGTTSATPVSTLYELNDTTSANKSYILFGVDITGGIVGTNISGHYISCGREAAGAIRDMNIHNFANANINLWTNNTQRLRVFGNGNIGINTTTDAGFRLDVNGTARVSGDISTNTVGTGFKGTISGSIRSWLYNATNGGQLYLYRTGSAVETLFFNGSSAGDSFINTGGGLVINSSTLLPSAQLQADSTTRGFLPPRMTTTQKNAIATPAAGLMVYDTTLNLISVYNGTTWITL